MGRRRWIVVAAVVALLGAGAGAVSYAVPGLAATACPGCYGLHDLGDHVYADTADPRLRDVVAAADRRIAAFYGERRSDPRVLICTTDDCYRRIGGGGEKGRALRDWSLMLSPAGANETIATHELSHNEFHERLGPARSKVPQWFDEGLAVLVSDDGRYLGPGPDRCTLPYEQALPVTTADWWSAAGGGDDRAYLQAACVVSRWTGRHGGSAGVLDLISRLRDGDGFTALVRP
ncbi:hypothetical protein COUCH_25480 [Couchioplanes caeruleus]|uniref:hypothetical protein n=1 Tax=Couchioplanes caeruleus TaxID=56438 RepID=UPI0020BE0BA7|nr:hypothetical protein [Couchioplanes caeruleus]UQU62375.1 hypothetical protein COUCH_25480 [Couchioplanes caeruleus]